MAALVHRCSAGAMGVAGAALAHWVRRGCGADAVVVVLGFLQFTVYHWLVVCYQQLIICYQQHVTCSLTVAIYYCQFVNVMTCYMSL